MIARLGLVLFGLLLAGLCLEILLRVSDIVPEVGSPLSSFHDGDADLGWRGRPDVRLRFHRPEFETFVAMGADGWRLPEPPTPEHAAANLLVVGDSFTWGWGASQGEVFTDRLQSRLGSSVAIVNRGISGFGTAQEYLLLRQEIAKRPYRDVLLMFFINDVSDNIDDHEGRRPWFDLVAGNLVPRNQPARVESRAVLDLLEHSRAWVFGEFEVGHLKRLWKKNEPGDEREFREAKDRDFHELPGYAVTARLFGEINRLCKEHHARFTVAYIPHRSEVVQDQPYPYARNIHDMVSDIARNEGFDVIDLVPAFRERARAGEGLVYPLDGHWTAAGHQLAADVLLASPQFR